ncbi:MAG: hypothetical protein QM639_00015 [Rhodocyclaceae bacterium]
MFSIPSLRLVAACGVAVVMTGCATFHNTEPPPAIAKPVSITYAEDGLSGLTDMPLGVFRVPDSEVLITGHQTPGVGGIMFGVLGMVAGDAIDSAAADNKTRDVQTALHFKVSTMAKEITQQQIASAGLSNTFHVDDGAAKHHLRIVSAMVMTYVSDTEVVPYVVLKPSLQDAQKTALWGTRYVAALGAPRPMVGENAWTADGGKPLREAASVALTRVVKVMLQDLVQPYPRDEKSLIVVETGYPFARMRMQGFGFKLWEDEETVGFVPKLGDVIVFTGVHVLDKRSTKSGPAPAGADPLLNLTPSQTQWPGQAFIASPKPFMSQPPQPATPPSAPASTQAPATTTTAATQ